MDNFIYGVLGVFRGIEESVRLLYFSPSVRGFLIGFFVATLFFAFIVTEQPKEEKQEERYSVYSKIAVIGKLLFSISLVLFNVMLILFFFFYANSI